jgi:hypothetical protein
MDARRCRRSVEASVANAAMSALVVSHHERNAGTTPNWLKGKGLVALRNRPTDPNRVERTGLLPEKSLRAMGKGNAWEPLLMTRTGKII